MEISENFKNVLDEKQLEAYMELKRKAEIISWVVPYVAPKVFAMAGIDWTGMPSESGLMAASSPRKAIGGIRDCDVVSGVLIFER